MFRRYSSPATDPLPSVSSRIEQSRASSCPGFTLAVTRYRTERLYYLERRTSACYYMPARRSSRPRRSKDSGKPYMMKLVEESSGIGELVLNEVKLCEVQYRLSRFQGVIEASGLPIPGLHRI